MWQHLVPMWICFISTQLMQQTTQISQIFCYCQTSSCVVHAAADYISLSTDLDGCVVIVPFTQTLQWIQPLLNQIIHLCYLIDISQEAVRQQLNVTCDVHCTHCWFCNTELTRASQNSESIRTQIHWPTAFCVGQANPKGLHQMPI